MKITCTFDTETHKVVSLEATYGMAQASYPADDNYMIVRKPEWKEHRIEKGEYFCCGGYTPCRGSCALFVAAPKGK